MVQSARVMDQKGRPLSSVDMANVDGGEIDYLRTRLILCFLNGKKVGDSPGNAVKLSRARTYAHIVK